jgi:hypothetical protein
MHFGLYLKNKGVIDAEQLVAAIEVQIEALVPIGQLALEEGLLNARQIFDVLRAQSGAPNIRFGDLAVELGLMTRDDVMRLLMIQGDRKMPIADILVRQGVLGEWQLKEELAAYRRSLIRPQQATMAIVPAPMHKDAARSATSAASVN